MSTKKTTSSTTPQLERSELHQLAWIRENLTTQYQWSRRDYQEFYTNDVTFLLELVERLGVEIPPLELFAPRDG